MCPKITHKSVELNGIDLIHGKQGSECHERAGSEIPELQSKNSEYEFQN